MVALLAVSSANARPALRSAIGVVLICAVIVDSVIVSMGTVSAELVIMGMTVARKSAHKPNAHRSRNVTRIQIKRRAMSAYAMMVIVGRMPVA